MDHFETRVRLVIGGKPYETGPVTGEQFHAYLSNFESEQFRNAHDISAMYWRADGAWLPVQRPAARSSS